jgi:hypothetical protein
MPEFFARISNRFRDSGNGCFMKRNQVVTRAILQCACGIDDDVGIGQQFPPILGAGSGNIDFSPFYRRIGLLSLVYRPANSNNGKAVSYKGSDTGGTDQAITAKHVYSLL